MTNIQPYQYVLVAGIVTAIATQPKAPPRFTLFLFAFVLLEAVGKGVKEILDVTNLPIMNVSALGSVAYYLYVFLQPVRPSWIRPTLGIYAITIAISLLTQGLSEIMSAAYIPGMLITLGAILMYLHHLIVKSNYVPLKRIPLFWMAVGVMIFFCSVFPMLVFGNALSAVDRPLASRLWSLVSYGNIFLALGFLAVSLCQLNTRTSSSPSP